MSPVLLTTAYFPPIEYLAAMAAGIASGYVTSFIDMGVNAIASLLTRNARLKQEWEETVNAENTWTYPISSVEEMRDFYNLERLWENGANLNRYTD